MKAAPRTGCSLYLFSNKSNEHYDWIYYLDYRPDTCYQSRIGNYAMEGRWRQETIGRYSCIAHQLDRTDLLLFLGKRQFTFNVEINRSICIKKENAVLKLRHFLFLLSYVRLPPFHRTDRSSVV